MGIFKRCVIIYVLSYIYVCVSQSYLARLSEYWGQCVHSNQMSHESSIGGLSKKLDMENFWMYYELSISN